MYNHPSNHTIDPKALSQLHNLQIRTSKLSSRPCPGHTHNPSPSPHSHFQYCHPPLPNSSLSFLLPRSCVALQHQDLISEPALRDETRASSQVHSMFQSTESPRISAISHAKPKLCATRNGGAVLACKPPSCGWDGGFSKRAWL